MFLDKITSEWFLKYTDILFETSFLQGTTDFFSISQVLFYILFNR